MTARRRLFGAARPVATDPRYVTVAELGPVIAELERQRALIRQLDITLMKLTAGVADALLAAAEPGSDDHRAAVEMRDTAAAKLGELHAGES